MQMNFTWESMGVDPFDTEFLEGRMAAFEVRTEPVAISADPVLACSFLQMWWHCAFELESKCLRISSYLYVSIHCCVDQLLWCRWVLVHVLPK